MQEVELGYRSRAHNSSPCSSSKKTKRQVSLSDDSHRGTRFIKVEKAAVANAIVARERAAERGSETCKQALRHFLFLAPSAKATSCIQCTMWGATR